MKRTILCTLAGALIGAILFYPPSVPLVNGLYEMEPDGFARSSKTIDSLSLVFPAIGLITGALVGGWIGRKRVSLALFRIRSCSIYFWCVAIFSVLGMELGLMLSFAPLMGPGSKATWFDFWFPPIFFGIEGTILGLFVGLFALLIYFALFRRAMIKTSQGVKPSETL